MCQLEDVSCLSLVPFACDTGLRTALPPPHFADMVGHTGNLQAAIEAVTVTDECVKARLRFPSPAGLGQRLTLRSLARAAATVPHGPSLHLVGWKLK